MEQTLVFAVVVAALVLFIWGRWRYDLVALGALLVLAVPGIVAPERAFVGFGHPAVITVVAVLLISHALEAAGLVPAAKRWLAWTGDRFFLQITALVILVAGSSAFMNNIGALALFMPVAIGMARETEKPASLYLMPLAFGSILGGLTTEIGTPPNIIIAAIRAQETGTPFTMFDFAPVGLVLAAGGVLFVAVFGWRLLPERRGEASPHELFEIDTYLSEARIPETSPWVGQPLEEALHELKEDLVVLGIVRSGREIATPGATERLEAGDTLILEADPVDLEALFSDKSLEPAGERELRDRFLAPDIDVPVTEAVVQPNSRLTRRSASELNLRSLHGVNLLGVARRGRRVSGRVGEIRFEAGDVLLLQGTIEAVRETLSSLGGLPLAERGLAIGRPRRLLLGLGIFAVAIALTVAGVVPIQISLTGAALLMVGAGLLTPGAAYRKIDWPVIVLLGAMIPLGEALESTGGASTIAGLLLTVGGNLSPEAAVATLMIVSLLLSNVINNAAATVLMAPIAIAIARGLGASPDPFLMAVAVGASCAFLTPIGHPSNTLVMGPGGYRFSDYFLMGLPLTILVLGAGVPLILRVWPL